MNVTPIAPEEVADLQAVVATLPYLRRKTLSEIAADPTVLACLRNVVRERRRAKDAAAARRIAAAEDFQLT